jgi:hypothetical protein
MPQRDIGQLPVMSGNRKSGGYNSTHIDDFLTLIRPCLLPYDQCERYYSFCVVLAITRVELI